VRLLPVAKNQVCSLTVEFLLDESRGRFLFRLSKAPDAQADFRIRETCFLPDSRISRR
jgi:hypothetical protein